MISTHIEILLRHIQAYSGIFSTLCNPRLFTTYPYSEPWHIQNQRTRGLFKALWNFDQTYSEPCHRASFSHIVEYSEPYATLAFRTLPYLRKFTNIQNSDIFKARHICRELSQRFKMEFFAKNVKNYNYFSKGLYLRSLTEFWIRNVSVSTH